jgi:hypothetical protein
MRLWGKRDATALRLWWRRNRATTLAVAFAALALVLFVVVLAQAEMLYTDGWRLALGTVPEWMAGFGTLFTALAALAAFGTLSVATHEWEGSENERQLLEKERQAADKERRALAATREAERRDHVMSQARLIIVEPAQPAWVVLPRSKPDDVVIRNHSSAPIFNIHIDDSYVLESKGGKCAATEMYIWSGNPNDALVYSMPLDIPVLAPGEATARLSVGGQPVSERTEWVGFSFTDAQGARWRRVGSQQPVQELESDSR